MTVPAVTVPAVTVPAARAKDLTVTVPAHTRHGNGHVEDVDYKRT